MPLLPLCMFSCMSAQQTPDPLSCVDGLKLRTYSNKHTYSAQLAPPAQPRTDSSNGRGAGLRLRLCLIDLNSDA